VVVVVVMRWGELNLIQGKNNTTTQEEVVAVMVV